MDKYLASLVLLGIAQLNSTPIDYLGQEPPENEPVLFAPGLVSNGLYNRDFTISSDGTLAYSSIVLGQHDVITIIEFKKEESGWAMAHVAPFVDSLNERNLEPCISPAGNQLFFMSDRPDPHSGRTGNNEDIWVVDRTDSGWSKPRNLGQPVSTAAAEFFPSVTLDGTLYFTRRDLEGTNEYIYRSRLVNGTYQEPEKLAPEVNGAPTQFNACIAPDESYIIVPAHGREDSVGGVDYYVSFRNPDDTWTGPINLGDSINTTKSQEYSPYISPDGKYLFFMSARFDRESLPESNIRINQLMEFNQNPGNGSPDIYWISTSVIKALRPTKQPD